MIEKSPEFIELERKMEELSKEIVEKNKKEPQKVAANKPILKERKIPIEAEQDASKDDYEFLRKFKNFDKENKKEDKKENNDKKYIIVGVGLIIILLATIFAVAAFTDKFKSDINIPQCPASPSCPACPTCNCPAQTCTCSPSFNGGNFSCTPVTNYYLNLTNNTNST